MPEVNNNNTAILLQQLAMLKENDSSIETVRQNISTHVNDLINHDFEKLVQLLYRLDIDEMKLKKALNEHGEKKAGDLIADLIIERQLQKIKSRQQFNNPDDSISDEEKW